MEGKYQILPALTEEEYQALKSDIAQRGVLVPVEYDDAGNILDGHHRVRACQELGISKWPSMVRIGFTEEEKIDHILKINLHRRHLTREQKIEIARRLRERGWSTRRIAEACGISAATVMRYVGASGVSNETPEEEREKITHVVGKDGKRYAATRPHVLVDHPRDVEKVISAVAVTGDDLPAKRLELRRIAEKASIKQFEQHIEEASKAASTLADDICILQCDFRELDIAPESVDLVFTDPPYADKNIPVFEDLSLFAEKVLKPGALLITCAGKLQLPEEIRLLSTHLRYYWTAAYTFHEMSTPMYFWHILSCWRPLLLFSKGEPHKRWRRFNDLIASPAREKNYHPWQQNLDVFLYYIEKFTDPGDLVVDPFLGSGTTAVACKRLKRRFIGCDIDEKAVKTALVRLAEEDGEETKVRSEMQ